MEEKQFIKPIIFEVKNYSEKINFDNFVASHSSAELIDTHLFQLEELSAIRNPFLKGKKNELAGVFDIFLKEYCSGRELKYTGTWVYFPWLNKIIHYLENDLHNELRTARNKNLITKEEQEKFANFTVGICGLSVGSHAALTIAMMGGSNTIKIADPDIIDGSNLNRIRFGFSAVAQKKAHLIAQVIYEMNPYADIHIFDKGLTKENYKDFLNAGKRVNVIVDEMDDFGLKIQLRYWAKEEKIPVVMVADNGDGVVADIERYDTDLNMDIFDGRVKNIPSDLLNLTIEQKINIVRQMVGAENEGERMKNSVNEVGKTLFSWPQLGEAATMAGVVIAYFVKKIAIGEHAPTTRAILSLDKLIFKNK